MSTKETPQDAFKRALAAATRSLSAQPDVEVVYGADRPMLRGARARLPQPPRALTDETTAIARGQADALALRLAHHDAACHAANAPEGPDAMAIYEAVEDARVEAIGATALRGVADNLAESLEKQYTDRGYARMEDRQDAPLADILSLLTREALTGAAPPETAARLVDWWRPVLEDKIAPRLEELKAAVDDQELFAKHVRDLLRDLDFGDQLGEEQSENEPSEEDEEEGQDADQDDEMQDEGDAPVDGEFPDDGMPDAMEAADDGAEEAEGDEEAQMDDDGMADAERASNSRPRFEGDSGERYKAYTTDFDQTIAAEELCDAEELERLRRTLDHQLESLHTVVSRLANRLQRRLMAQQNRAWMFDLDEGVLDAARLARVVADPMQPLSYKQEQDQEFRDTVVTLLLDNSGSMRGRPITIAAICADILARTLERCGVKVEILGFTTRAWKGGQAREKWVKDGRPPTPGRLNDLRHIIYKSADAPWRRARTNLGLMMREGILKENIDGEALMWAHNRLMARPEARRILMVISDGAPVDDTTSSTNGGAYLERHLREVIAYIEGRSPAELIAIGIGHDVTRYYQRAVTIVEAEQLGGAMVDKLAELFEEDIALTNGRSAA
ncbi:MAG: cobaltochelatase subunit CobT [Pseudomonadota bacterium]